TASGRAAPVRLHWAATRLPLVGNPHACTPTVCVLEAHRSGRTNTNPRKREFAPLAVGSMQQLLEAGVHFGHQTRRWNPKMKRFIFGERNGIYIIDLQQTLERIEKAYHFVRDLSAEGGTIMFIGTKKQAQEPIAEGAGRSGMPFVNQRWLGGMLTNFTTIHGRVSKMNDLERQVNSPDFAAVPKKEALLL